MMSRAFSARAQLGCDDPKALPWAGMNQAFGLEDTEASNSKRFFSAILIPFSARMNNIDNPRHPTPTP